MTFHFLSRDGHRLFARDDALSAKHYCADFAFEACFPIRADRPLEVGMIAAWQDDDDLWEAHEIVSAEPDAYGDSVTLTGCHIALSELRSAVLAEAKYDGAAIAAVLDGLLADTPWQRGVLPAALESDAARRERYRVTTRVSRLNLRSGPGTRYKSLGLYKKGTYVSLIEKTNSSWYRVEAPDGRTGWMSTTYLTRDGSVAAAAESECRATLDETWITAWAALEAAAKSAGLLIAPRVALTDAGISGRWIDLRPTDPEYRGVRLTCDSNIRQAGVKFDISGLYTSMTGLGRDDMTFSDAAWSTSGGDPADKPRGQTFVEIPSARALWGRSRRAIVRFPEETDASRLLARTWEQLTAAAQPRVTIDATIADLYPLGYGGQSMRLYDAVQVILRPIGLRMHARITGLTRDLIAPERTRPVIGAVSATDIVQDVLTAASGAQRIDSWQVRSISGDSISPGTVDSVQLKDASVSYAKIAVAAVEQLAANALSAVSAHIAQLVAGEIEADSLYADLATIAVAQLTTATIQSAAIDWAQIASLTAQVATIAKAQLTTATIQSAAIDWAQIASLTAAMADVAQAKIADAQITTAQIADLRAEIARVITLAAQDGRFDFASIRDLLAGAMILEEGVAGSVYIKNLVATRANFVGATLGELILRGADGNYYAVTVQADGTIHTQPVTVSEGEISAGQTSDGRQIVATTANIADLNASSVRAESAILSEIFAGALSAGKISAQEAFLASATVPELRVTALTAIGDALDLSANASIRLLVNGRTVGGRNLLRNTAELRLADYAIDASGASAIGSCEADGAGGLRVVCADQNVRIWLADALPVTPGQRYAASVRCKIATGAPPIMFQYVYRNAALEAVAYGQSIDTQTSRTEDGWTVISDVLTVPEGADITCMRLALRTGHDFALYSCDYRISRPKFECGDTATDWTPAPEDADARMAAAETALTLKADRATLDSKTEALQSQIDMIPGQITLAVSDVQLGGKNLIQLGGIGYPNLSFWPDGFIASTGGTGYYYEGGYHIQIPPFTTAHAEAMFTQPLSVSPGQYVLSFWAWTYGADVAVTFRPNLFWPGSEDAPYRDHYPTDFLTPPVAVPRRYELPVTIDYTQPVRLRFVCQTPFSTGMLFLSDVKFEHGNKATGWTPAPEDPVPALMTSSIAIRNDRVDIATGGSLNVDSGAVNISTSDFRVSVQNPGDAENEVIGIDPDYGRISVDELLAKNVRPYAPYAEYRLSEIGSIREFANILRDRAFGFVRLCCDRDEYGSTPVVFERVQAHRIDIFPEGGYRHTLPWQFDYCSAQVYAANMIWDCGADVNAVTLHSGDVYLNSCCIISARTGLYCDQISRGSWAGFAHYADGYCAERFALAAEAADVAIYGHIPGSPEPLAVVHAARGTTRDITVHSSQSAAAPAYQSATLTGALGWISTKKGWSDGAAYQGYTTGKGECYGCFRFTLPAATAIVSATLTLHRRSSTGKGAPVDVHIYGSGTAWGSRPSLGTLYASRADAVLAGNTVSLDVTAAAQALLSGSIAQLVAYEGDGTTLSGHEYSTDYCAWDAATLDVTYTT